MKAWENYTIVFSEARKPDDLHYPSERDFSVVDNETQEIRMRGHWTAYNWRVYNPEGGEFVLGPDGIDGFFKVLNEIYDAGMKTVEEDGFQKNWKDIDYGVQCDTHVSHGKDFNFEVWVWGNIPFRYDCEDGVEKVEINEYFHENVHKYIEKYAKAAHAFAIQVENTKQ